MGTEQLTMPNHPYICVFCGSSRGAHPIYVEAARRVGSALARTGLGLVYGGGRVGLMGTVADAGVGEATAADLISQVTLGSGQDGINYDFFALFNPA